LLKCRKRWLSASREKSVQCLVLVSGVKCRTHPALRAPLRRRGIVGNNSFVCLSSLTFCHSADLLSTGGVGMWRMLCSENSWLRLRSATGGAVGGSIDPPAPHLVAASPPIHKAPSPHPTPSSLRRPYPPPIVHRCQTLHRLWRMLS